MQFFTKMPTKKTFSSRFGSFEKFIKILIFNGKTLSFINFGYQLKYSFSFHDVSRKFFFIFSLISVVRLFKKKNKKNHFSNFLQSIRLPCRRWKKLLLFLFPSSSSSPSLLLVDNVRADAPAVAKLEEVDDDDCACEYVYLCLPITEDMRMMMMMETCSIWSKRMVPPSPFRIFPFVHSFIHHNYPVCKQANGIPPSSPPKTALKIFGAYERELPVNMMRWQMEHILESIPSPPPPPKPHHLPTHARWACKEA